MLADDAPRYAHPATENSDEGAVVAIPTNPLVLMVSAVTELDAYKSDEVAM